MISGHTELYGVLGHPVAHSLSPAMHNAAFEAVGIDAAYVALPVAPEALPEALRGAHALGFRGLNVTVPHKQRAAELCQALDETARLCGAANTLRRAASGWEGFNTDAPACRDLAQAAGAEPGQRALVLLQATSVGLAGAAPGTLPASPRRGQLAIDFVYGDTGFARAARATGATLVTGEQLLLRQGALAFTLFTGRPAPEPVMARALAAAPRAP